MKRRSRPSCDDVLDAFAVEPEIGRATLERYLREFPEYAADIVDLAVELMREAAINDQPLSQREQNLIAAAWGMHAAAAPSLPRILLRSSRLFNSKNWRSTGGVAAGVNCVSRADDSSRVGSAAIPDPTCFRAGNRTEAAHHVSRSSSEFEAEPKLQSRNETDDG